nr:hypothetical protein [Evansella caseinilytica]
MKVMSRSKIVREKVSKIQAGYSAYAETKEVCDLIKKELASLGIDVIEDVSPQGHWFIPADKG